MRLVVAVLLALLLACSDVSANGKIEHVVVLMLENRAFDHMCGWLNQWLGNGKIDGLTGAEYNVANGTNWYVKDSCPYVNPFDPLHDVHSVTREVMGGDQWIDPSPMSGFAQVHMENNDPDFWMVMHGFAPDLVPAISTLAENFVIFDKYYSSLPGPTYPNRMFWHSGTSHGMTGNSILDYLPGQPQRTMFDVYNDQNISWAVYYQDLSDTILFTSLRELKNLEKLHAYDQFVDDVASGDLPTYTWVTPQFFPSETVPARDQHPDHDVVQGEKMIAEVYGILRNSSLWNKTAFIVTYDEHGGLYDHVPPPFGCPNPDGIIAKDGFNFTRMGVRVPMLIASPWVPKGLVVGEPDNVSTHFEHSSAWATFRRMFSLEEELTNRTAWAAPFDFVFSEAQPRTDCPLYLPTPASTPGRDEALLRDQQRRSPNDLQKQFFAVLESALGKPVTMGAAFTTQLDMGKEVRAMMSSLVKRAKA